MSKRKPKVEARPCWYLLDDAGNACWRSLITPKERAKRIRSGNNYAFMVPADPRRDAELKALRKLAEAAAVWVKAEPGSDPFGDAENALSNAVAAVEKMQRGGK